MSLFLWGIMRTSVPYSRIILVFPIVYALNALSHLHLWSVPGRTWHRGHDPLCVHALRLGCGFLCVCGIENIRGRNTEKLTGFPTCFLDSNTKRRRFDGKVVCIVKRYTICHICFGETRISKSFSRQGMSSSSSRTINIHGLHAHAPLSVLNVT